jgi:phenylpropionate dioxygenase-like ring-hydroxylating dioxygenase large terminal subunit
MIRNQWYVVLDSVQVKKKPVGVRRMGEKLVFWRDEQGRLACIADCCCHRSVALSPGKLVDGRLQCPFHGFEYEASGRVVVIPANGRTAPVPKAFRVQSYPVHEAHGVVWLWWGDDPPADLKPPRFFDDIGDEFSYGQRRDPFKAHYSRAIENQLDVVHLPFVHANTIGGGGRTLVDGPGVKWLDEDMFYVYVHNRVEDGRPPLKPSEFPLDPEPEFKLEFIFPNLWQNHLGEAARIVLAFVPVDEGNSILYLRFYQKSVRLPLLRALFNWLAMPFNLYILHQDRRVVETHDGPSTLRGAEQLIPGDYPIVAYRRRREELKRAAENKALISEG